MKHTPGPWRLKTAGTFDQQGIMAGPFELMGETVNGLTIANVDYSILIDTISATEQDHHKRAGAVARLRDWERANAKLIAGAPDMLLALKRISEIPGATKLIKELADAAIKNATL